jgi:hypothetical protein
MCPVCRLRLQREPAGACRSSRFSPQAGCISGPRTGSIPTLRKILVASIAKPLSSLHRTEVASVVSAPHPLRRRCTLGISCDGSSSAD